MLLRLKGILSDGSPEPRTGNVDPRKTLRMVRGESLVLSIEVVNTAGAPVNLASKRLFFSMRVTADALPVMQGSVTLPSGKLDNFASITITAAQSKDVEVGRYLYDLWLLDTDNRYCLIPMSAFFLEASLTKAT